MSAFGNDSNILKRGTLRPKMWSLKHMWTESGCNQKKEVRKRWKFISGKNNQSEGNVIPEGPWKHLSPQNALDYVQIHGRRWGRMILVKGDERRNERWARALATVSGS